VLRWITPYVAHLVPVAPVPAPIAPARLSTDPAVGIAYRADPANVRITTPALGAALLRAIRDANLHLHDLDIATLVVHGGDDRIVPTWSTEVLGRLPCVERRVFDGLRHEVHNEPTGDVVVGEIAGWIHERLPRGRPGPVGPEA
jgi:alpha-beta hydrolase superfamily lysophospholipase